MGLRVKSFGATVACISLASLALLNPAAANEIELSFSDELIDLRYTMDHYNNFFGRAAIARSDYDDIDTNHANYTIFAQDKLESFDVLLGARAFWLDAEDDDGYGVALGIGVSREILFKLHASVEVYYAPDIITGGDFDDLFDADLRLRYQLLENASLFVGYRKLEVDAGQDVDIYDDPYVGIKFVF